MTKEINLNDIASNGKTLVAFVSSTIAKYNVVAIALHQTACMVLHHVAEGHDPLPLNLFYNGLRVNDKTALRVWLGEHASYVDAANDTVRPWLSYTEAKGFAVIKGKEAHRKDKYTIDTQEEGKTMLLATKPFYEKNVKLPSAITLEALVAMLAQAAEKVEKQSEKEGIALPASIANLVKSTKNAANFELAALQRVEADKPN